MRTSFLLLLLVSVGPSAFAQKIKKWPPRPNIMEVDSTRNFEVELPKKVKAKHLYAVAKFGTLDREHKSTKYTYTATQPGMERIRVYSTKRKDTTIIYQQNFMTVPAYGPEAGLADIFSGDENRTLSKAKLMATRGLTLKTPVWNHNFEVVSFSLAMKYSGRVISHDSEGNGYSKVQRNCLNATKKGSLLYYYNILVRDPSGREYCVRPLRIKVS